MALPRIRPERAERGRVAKLVGRVAPGELLTAPRSGRACVLYESLREHDDGQRFEVLALEARGFRLLCEPGEARVEIDPREPRLVVLTRSIAYRDAAGRVFHERSLREGQMVAVAGRVSFEAGLVARAGYRDLADRRVVLSAPAGGPLLIARDGTAFGRSAR